MTFFRISPVVPKNLSVLPLLCIFSARSFGYACLILIALVSRDAVAQQAIALTFLPGEFDRAISVAPGNSLQVSISTPGYVCRWPSLEDLRSSISSPSMNQSRLNHLESIGTTSGEDIVQAMNVLLPLAVDRSPAPVVFYRGGRGDGTAQGLPVNASFYVVRFSSGRRCLELEDARNGVYQIRRVIRAHLGLPAPAVAPTVFEIPAAGAPTSLGAPAPAQAR